MVAETKQQQQASQTLPLHAYMSEHWFEMSKPLNYAVSTKSG